MSSSEGTTRHGSEAGSGRFPDPFAPDARHAQPAGEQAAHPQPRAPQRPSATPTPPPTPAPNTPAPQPPFAPGTAQDSAAHAPSAPPPRLAPPAASGSRDLPWKATAERRTMWGPRPAQGPLEGKVHPPHSKAVSVPRRRGKWLTRGVPTVLGGVSGFSVFTVFGIAALIGGAGLLWPLAAGLGVGAVVGGGSAFLLRNRKPAKPRLTLTDADMAPSTRALLEEVVDATTQQRRRIVELRRRSPGSAVKSVLQHADSLLARIDALLGHEVLQGRRPSDGDVMMLEGMSSRYIPELLDATEETIRFLASFQGDARREALANLKSIDEQLAVLAEGVERIEGDVVSGVTRSLEVHHEFLTTRLADRRLDPTFDV